MNREEIEARIADLEAANAKAPGWGAAVGARAEEIRSLRQLLATMENTDDYK